MPRKGPAVRRSLTPDPVYRSSAVTQLVNKELKHGKRSTAEQIVYGALKVVETKTGSEPVGVLKDALESIRPQLEVRSRRVGGATYQVPGGANPALLVDNPNFNRKIPTNVGIQLRGNLIKPDDPIFDISFPNSFSL